MIVVQTFNRAGWPPNSTIELEAGAAAALLTAVRDYEAEKQLSLHGDYLAAPVGGDRTMAEVVEMRSAFRAPRSSALWLTIGRDKYNMDPNSTAIPSLTSPHLTGECLDISNTGFLAWLIVNGARYGLKRTLVKENDLRHFQYEPGTATAALDVTSLNGGAVAPVRTTPPMTNTRLIADVTTTPPTFYWLDIGPDQTLRASHMTQAQANIAATNIGTPTNVVSSPAEVQAVQQVLAALTPSGGSPIDPAALAKALAPLLDTVTEAELTAALAKIKFPTKGTLTFP